MRNLNTFILIQSDKVIEQQVRNIIGKNKAISLRLLVDQVCNNLQRVPYLEKTEVENTIKKMIHDSKILIGSKLVNQEILENIDRKRILSNIIQHPGFTIEELSNSLGIPKDRLVWHLTFLQKFQFIKTVKTRVVKKYHPTKKAVGLE